MEVGGSKGEGRGTCSVLAGWCQLGFEKQTKKTCRHGGLRDRGNGMEVNENLWRSAVGAEV